MGRFGREARVIRAPRRQTSLCARRADPLPPPPEVCLGLVLLGAGQNPVEERGELRDGRDPLLDASSGGGREEGKRVETFWVERRSDLANHAPHREADEVELVPAERVGDRDGVCFRAGKGMVPKRGLRFLG